jgi:hypothetical protein
MKPLYTRMLYAGLTILAIAILAVVLKQGKKDAPSRADNKALDCELTIREYALAQDGVDVTRRRAEEIEFTLKEGKSTSGQALTAAEKTKLEQDLADTKKREQQFIQTRDPLKDQATDCQK